MFSPRMVIIPVEIVDDVERFCDGLMPTFAVNKCFICAAAYPFPVILSQ